VLFLISGFFMYREQNILVVIPARGGSKRIPQKNIIHLSGKPMIAWTIEAAKKSQYVDTVLVSTDCEVIKKVAQEYGAEVPFMRLDAADDYSPVSEATLSALLQSEEYYGAYDIVVQLMANCPLRGVKEIDTAIESFYENEQESQISFFKYGWMNPWWAHTINNNVPSALFKQAGKKRSQDLNDLFCPTGAIWICKSEILKKYKTFYSPNYRANTINWISAMDIDDYDDLKMAEALFNIRNGEL
jgi:CMP-N-acetylneuraminic acid synthetase